MPKFIKEVEFEFEVYCNTCGAWLCNQSEVVESWTCKFPQIRVDVCDDCIEKAKEKAIEPIEDEISELEDEIKVLKEKLELING